MRKDKRKQLLKLALKLHIFLTFKYNKKQKNNPARIFGLNSGYTLLVKTATQEYTTLFVQQNMIPLIEKS